MKPRTVFVTLELLTDLSLRHLRERHTWTDLNGCVQIYNYRCHVEQIQANVAKPKLAEKRRSHP